MAIKPKTQDKYFGWQHLRLLSIASWAKNAAWAAVVLYIFVAGTQILYIQSSAIYKASNNSPTMDGVLLFLSTNPLELIKLGINMAATMFQGFVYYLMLRGVFLGLNMIVETDINYRDKPEGGAK